MADSFTSVIGGGDNPRAEQINMSMNEPIIDMHHQPSYGSTLRGRNKGRLVNRDAPFNQSSDGKLGTYKIIPAALTRSIFFRDWYHWLMNTRTSIVLFICATVYLCVITIWAGFFWANNDNCDLQMNHFLDAMYISLETVSTIGFGLPVVYFNQCTAGFL